MGREESHTPTDPQGVGGYCNTVFDPVMACHMDIAMVSLQPVVCGPEDSD